MHPVSQLKVFIAHAAVGIFALAAPASAATLFVNVDTTVSSDVTGDPGSTGAPDSGGIMGGAGVEWTATLVDVIINAGVTITGGVGGDAGVDVSNNGGNLGGTGGGGLQLFEDGGTVTAAVGATFIGGVGGAGSNGGTGGASDTAGGIGGLGGYGINIAESGNQVTLTGAAVKGGAGGVGGAAGDVAGDPANTAKGGTGGYGGSGIAVNGGANAVINLTGTTVTGGDGVAGGVSLAGATNANGGSGGSGITTSVGNTNTSISVDATSIVIGGNGGAAGSGGSGGVAGFDGAGVYLQGTGATLTNHGTILGSETMDVAAVFVTGNTTLVDNYGTIGAAANHAGYGVLVTNGVTLSTLHNQAGGLIQSTANNAAVFVGSGNAITNFVNEGSIINSGSGEAVALFGTVGSFSNSGLIHADGGVALTISSASVADVILNTGGTISASGGGTTTVLIFPDMGAAGVTFDGGTISHTPGGGAIHVAKAQTGSVAIKNASVTGAITFSAADETLNVTASALEVGVLFAPGSNNLNFLAGGGTTTLSAGSSLYNATFVSLLSNASVVSNALLSDATSSIGKLTTNVGSHLTLNSHFHADDQVLNLGTILIGPNSALSSTSFSGDGHYVFGVTNGATHGKIAGVAGAGSLDFAGASFGVELTNPSTNFVAGTAFMLAIDQDNEAITGVIDGTMLADNSALLSFLLYRGDAIGFTSNQLYAQVQIALLADIAGEGDDPNSIALGAALDEIGLDGDADLDDLMLDLALLGTNKEINNVLDALLPETDGVAYDLATDAGDQMLDVASRRLDGLRGSTGASLEYRVASLSLLGLRGTTTPAARSQLWGQAFGRTVDQSKHSYNDGYDAGSYGFAVGADTALDNATQLGAAFSYTSTDADGAGINRTDTEVESYQLTLYGDHLFDNAVYAKGLLAYGWHANDIARHDVGGVPGDTATGSYDADHITARAELGRAYKGGANFTLIPRAHVNAAWYSPDGYSEQGVGGLGLAVAPDDLTSVRAGVGVLARWSIPLSPGELFQPELRLDYRRDLTRDRFETTAEFLGASGVVFRTQGVEPPADILNLGVGALLATAGGVDLRASYDLELKEDYTAHAGYVRASIPF